MQSIRSTQHPAFPGAPLTSAASRSQVPYEVRDSPIAGKGIFATASVARGALLWKYAPGASVVEHDELSLRARLAGMAEAERHDLLEHIYCWDGRAIEILDDAKIWNHSVTPNSGLHPDPDAGVCDGVSSYALRDIAVGEEVTDDYVTFHEVDWFERICKEFGAESCIAVGHTYR